MTETSGNLLRSVVAVVAGIVVGVALSLITDMAMRSAGIFPALGVRMADPLLGLAVAYRTVYGVASSYVTARLAPNRPMGHALLLGALGLFVNVVGTALTWNKGPAFGPHWYPLVLIVLALPTAWLGGKLRVMQLGGQS
jgi:hypothetical protein